LTEEQGNLTVESYPKVAEEPDTKKNCRMTEEQGIFTKNDLTWQKVDY